MKFGSSGNSHAVGSAKCSAGLCGMIPDYPKRHKDCGGMLHIEAGDDYPGGYESIVKCDKCGFNSTEENVTE